MVINCLLPPSSVLIYSGLAAMHTQGFLLWVISKKRIFSLLFAVLTLPFTLFPIPSSHAQEVSPTVKKNVVKNFKVNLSEYSSFGTDCSKKPQGDANCDGSINQFDLSIWEVEFNSPNSPRRSDFNNDGAITLLDFGIWRNTFYGSNQKTSLLNKILTKLTSLITHNPSLITVHAQESASGAAEISSSSTFTSSSGNSLVINSLTGNNTSQVNFNSSGNPTTAQFFNQSGIPYAEAAFLETGGTIITTEDSGIPIVINKTAAGPVVENFKNPEGTLLAIKSWPTQQSYDSGEPPLSVTIPGQGTTREVLNIQPNGDAIVEKINLAGSILSRTQIRNNGTQITQDFQNPSIVQSNSVIGFTSLTLDNNLNGQTQYMFFKGELYAVVQTDNQKNAYVAKPLDTEGNSWNIETLVDGVKRSEKTTTNPIAELNSNTPDPKTLIQYINHYKQATPNNNSVNFSDGFTSTAPTITNPVAQANALLTISQTQPPAVLGIIKEAFAQNAPSSPPGVNVPSGWGTPTITPDPIGTQEEGTRFQHTGYQYTYTKESTSETLTVNVTVYSDPSAHNTSQNPNAVPASGVVINGGSVSDGRGGGSQLSSGTLTSAGAPAPAGASGGQPAAPVAAAPAPGVGDWKSNQQGDKPGTEAEAVRAFAAKAAGDKAQETSGGPAVKAEVAKSEYTKAFDAAYQQNFSRSITLDALAMEERNNSANAAFVQTFVSSTVAGVTRQDGLVDGNVWNSPAAVQARTQAIDTLKAQGVQVNFTVKDFDNAPPGHYATGTRTTSDSQGSAPGSGASRPSTAAAAAATGIAAPQSGFIGNTGVYSQVTQNLGNGTFVSTIKSGGREGETIATQTHNPTTGFSSWTDSRGTTTTEGGVVTAYAPNNNPFSPGTTYATTPDGQIVAVGSNSVFDVNGHVAAGRSVTGAELTFAQNELSRQANETFNTTGVNQADFATALSTCFLPGTLISTPNGLKAIETLTTNDKVYSYNEKTGAKEISGFEELDINFVDEYLIINNQIKTTVYHPFYTVIPSASEESVKNTKATDSSALPQNDNLITVRADELKIGNILQNEKGQNIPVYSIEKVNAPKTTVYNLNNVSRNNNFFAEGVLVHNYDPVDTVVSNESRSDYVTQEDGTITEATYNDYNGSWDDPGWSSGGLDGSSSAFDGGSSNLGKSSDDSGGSFGSKPETNDSGNSDAGDAGGDTGQSSSEDGL